VQVSTAKIIAPAKILKSLIGLNATATATQSSQKRVLF
jgi:hypothetical protein